jgi:hypothetical protein
MRAGEPLPRSTMMVALTCGILLLTVAAAVLVAVS